MPRRPPVADGAILTGAVTLAATGSIVGGGTYGANLIGLVDLQASGVIVQSGDCAMTGDVTFASTAWQYAYTSASMACSVTLASDALVIVDGAAAIAEAVNFTPTPEAVTYTANGFALMAGAVDMVPDGLPWIQGASALAGSVTLELQSGSAVNVFSGEAVLAGLGAIASDALVIHKASATLTGIVTVRALEVALMGLTPTERIFITPAEIRRWAIPAESRVLVVGA